MIANLDCLGKTLFDDRLERLSSGDGETQIHELMHTEKEGYAYNELVAHLPLHSLENPERVMIMGGGSLFTAQEVLKHPSIKEIDVVDYDSKVTEIVVDHYDNSLARVRTDPRVHLRTEDIREFLKSAPPSHYDAVLDDLIDVVRPEDQWVLDLFPSISRVLKPSGLFGTYLYPSWYHGDLNRLITDKLKRGGFHRIMVTDENVFTYSWPEGFTAFLCAAPEWPWTMGETNRLLRRHFIERNTPTRQFHPNIHSLHDWEDHPSAIASEEER